MGIIEDRCRVVDKQRDSDDKSKNARNSKEISDFFKLTQEVIDSILSKAKNFTPSQYKWINLDGKDFVGWCFGAEDRHSFIERFVISDGRMVSSKNGKSELYFPNNIGLAKNDHRAIVKMAEHNFGIKPKKHWILKEDKKGLAKFFG